MIDAENIPPIENTEMLARYIVNANEYRKSDDTVKPKLFMPYKHVKLSVNRHRDCIADEIWAVGADVAQQREKTFHGRSDIIAYECRIDSLDVEPEPIPRNPNHADITGFPPKKEDQQSLAIKLAAAASKRKAPPESESD